MKYNDVIQLYFERTTALQNYWTLCVVIVGGLLAFASLRKQPAVLARDLLERTNFGSISSTPTHPYDQ